MLKEAFEYLVNRGRDDRKITKVEGIPDDPRRVMLNVGGVPTVHLNLRPVRKHLVYDFDSLFLAAKLWTKDRAVAYVHEDGVNLILNDAEGHDVVTMPFLRSEVGQLILELRRKPTVDQRTLLRYLRTQLFFLDNVNTLITAVRALKWKDFESGHSMVQHGSESLGKSVEMEVAGLSEIPEAMSGQFSPYKLPLEFPEVPITFDLEVNMDRTFSLRPLADDLDRAMATALASIVTKIQENEIDAVLGKPS